jgi:hypothetical protein
MGGGEETYRVADALEEEEQEETGNAAVARAKCGSKAARDARDAVNAEQKGGIDEAQEPGADETSTGERKLTEGEHETRVRVTDAYALVDEIVHRERGNAHLRAAAERTHASFETKMSEQRDGEQGTYT